MKRKAKNEGEKLKNLSGFDDVIRISVPNPQKVQDSDFVKIYDVLEKEGLLAFGSVTIERDKEDIKRMLLFIRNESGIDGENKNRLKNVLANLQKELQIPHLKIW